MPRKYNKINDKSTVDVYITKYYMTHSIKEIYAMLLPLIPNITETYVRNRKSWLQEINELPKKRKFYAGLPLQEQVIEQPKSRVEVIGNRTIHRML